MNRKSPKKAKPTRKAKAKSRRPRRVDPSVETARSISHDTTDALIDHGAASAIAGKTDHGLHFEIATLVSEKHTPIRVARVMGDVPLDPEQANAAFEEVLAMGTLCFYEGPPQLERMMREPCEPASDAGAAANGGEHARHGDCGAHGHCVVDSRKWVIRLNAKHGAGFVQIAQERGDSILFTATVGGEASVFLRLFEAAMRKAFPLHPPAVFLAQTRRKIMLVTEQRGELVPTVIGHFDVPLTRENYGQHTLDGFDRVAAELRSNCPTGRLVIIDGPPGTGKTYFIRGLLEAVSDCVFLLLPPRLVRELDGPHLQSFLLSLRVFNGPVVLILEDAEQALVERGLDNQSMLTTLLQATDGFLADLLDLRVIATTNIDLRKEKLDPAVARDGRLLAHITIEHRSRDELQTIFRRLVARDDATLPEGVSSIAETYRAAREAGWIPPAVVRVAQEDQLAMIPHGTRYANPHGPLPYPRPMGYGA